MEISIAEDDITLICKGPFILHRNCVAVPIYQLLSAPSHCSFAAFQVKMNLTFMRHCNAVTSQFLCKTGCHKSKLFPQTRWCLQIGKTKKKKRFLLLSFETWKGQKNKKKILLTTTSCGVNFDLVTESHFHLWLTQTTILFHGISNKLKYLMIVMIA